MEIWLLAGYAGSGKTTAGKILSELLPCSETTAFAKEVKNQVSDIYRFPREWADTQEGKATYIENKQKTVRQLLVEHSAWIKRISDSPGIWAEYVCTEIRSNLSIRHWILHDWRYTTEYETLRNAFPTARIRTLRIESHVVPSSCPSEHELDTTDVEYVVKNLGTKEELYIQLKSLLEKNNPHNLI